MEFVGDLHHHHRVDENEEAGSDDQILMLDNNNNIDGTHSNNHHHNVNNNNLNRVKMVDALSQVQIHQPNPTPPPPPPQASASNSMMITTSVTTKPKYRECLRNHAINVMGHALDGCGEFMPNGPEGSVEALKCAACNCHRNFHRKEDPTHQQHHHHHATTLLYTSHSSHGFHHRYNYNKQSDSSGRPFGSAPSGYLHLGPPPHPRPLALPSASGGGGSQSEGEEDEDEDVSDPIDGTHHHNGVGGSMNMMMRMNGVVEGSKKRFRTKFTAEQKERMLEMAERIGWRIQKCDEDLVHQFCNEMNVKRHVFKVWMHNNKHTLGKSVTTTTTTTSSNLNINNNNSSSSNTSSRQQQQQQLMN